MKTSSEIIDHFGGTANVARIFEISSASVSEWRKKGIPKARMMYLKLLRPGYFDSNQGHDHANQTQNPSQV